MQKRYQEALSQSTQSRPANRMHDLHSSPLLKGYKPLIRFKESMLNDTLVPVNTNLGAQVDIWARRTAS